MTTPLSELAATLSEAQREAVSSLAVIPERRSIDWCVKMGFALEGKGLVRRTFWSDASYLTPLGEALRNHLKGEME